MRGCICVTANADAPGLTAFLTGLAPDREPGCGVRVMGTVLQCHRRHRTDLHQVPISTVNEGVSSGGPNSCSGTQARLEDVAGGQQLRLGGAPAAFTPPRRSRRPHRNCSRSCQDTVWASWSRECGMLVGRSYKAISTHVSILLGSC